MSKRVYTIYEIESGDLVAKYRTFQGNVKAAFFTEERHAQNTIEKYLAHQYPNHKFHVGDAGRAFDPKLTNGEGEN